MSKGSGWVPIDKTIVSLLGSLKRPYSPVEAMISLTVDIDCGKSWTVSGYAKLWKWSRCKVRKFVTECQTDRGHEADTKGTQRRHPIHFIDKGLWGEEDTKKTVSRQLVDTKAYTTSNPNPNPKETTCPVNGEIKEISIRVINYLNKKTGRKYKIVQSNIDLIKARLNEGYKAEDFKTVIDNQFGSWFGDPEKEEYLRPATLFQKKKFDNYLNNTKITVSKSNSAARETEDKLNAKLR